MATKEELEQLILVDKLPYTTLGKMFGVSDKTIKQWAIKLGIDVPSRKNIIATAICPNCNIEFKPAKNGRGGRTECCSVNCRGEYQSKNHYEEYKSDNLVAYGQSNMRTYKKFFLEEQDHKCDICKLEDTWNNQSLVFVLDHIDGNADNNDRSNLRLICPNCDSQLVTFKSKNKNSARAKYRK